MQYRCPRRQALPPRRGARDHHVDAHAGAANQGHLLVELAPVVGPWPGIGDVGPVGSRADGSDADRLEIGQPCLLGGRRLAEEGGEADSDDRPIGCRLVTGGCRRWGGRVVDGDNEALLGLNDASPLALNCTTF